MKSGMWLSQAQVRWLIVLLALLPLIPTVFLVHNLTQNVVRERDSAVAELSEVYRYQLGLAVENFSISRGDNAPGELASYLTRVFGEPEDLAVVDPNGKSLHGDPKMLTGNAIVYEVASGGAEGWTVYLDHHIEAPEHIEEQYNQAWRHAIWILTGVILVAGGVWYTVHRRLRIDVIRSDLLNTISHEIKTPVSAIRVLAETLENCDTEGETTREYISLIKKENERVGDLAERFLTICRLDRGQIRVSPTPCHLPDLIEDQVLRVEAKFAGAGGSIEWDCPESLVTLVDRNAMEVVLNNLLENALKYGGDPPVARVIAGVSGRWVEISVVDEGSGVPKKERRAIFRRFYRSDSQLNGARCGAGLGLSICRRFMKLVNGGIRVEDSPAGGGARFVVSFPNLPVS